MTTHVMDQGSVMEAPVQAEPGAGVYNEKLGMWIFLASEVMFFTSLIGSYIILRFAHPEMWKGPGEVLNVALTAGNTFLLICSSVTMVKAFAAVQDGDQAGLRKWLIATTLIGATFVGVQIYEYAKLVEHGFVPSEGLYGSTFYTMTGFHGFHVTIGVICLLFVTIKAFQGKYTATDHRGVEVVGLYWHFVDLVWIILFTIVYLI
ncbi:MAG: cytochrome c oxidase subunit 3 [Gemmatimonadota bacterium]|jgi:heme/copper-type cytochrome/quinol oxidase subunit 3|nr:cytochrome c oxidase subunit 3 [Gemmatimonadota bacterium]